MIEIGDYLFEAIADVVAAEHGEIPEPDDLVEAVERVLSTALWYGVLPDGERVGPILISEDGKAWTDANLELGST